MKFQDIQKMNVDELRAFYINIREKTINLQCSDYTQEQFKSDVFLVIRQRELEATPQIIAACAYDVYCKAIMEDWHQQEF